MKTAKAVLWLLFGCLARLAFDGAMFAQTNPHTAPSANATAANADPVPAANSLNTFGLKLFSEIDKPAEHKNVFISPLSVFFALAMTESGAGGSTQTAMREALAVPSHVGEDALHQSSSALMKWLQGQKGVQLNIANALWADARWPLAADFVKRCHDLYQADATSLDLSSPGAASRINAWVKEKTQNKIPEIVSPKDLREMAAVLTNAVYFKGGWQYEFSKNQTQEGDFHLAGDNQAAAKTKKVHFMHNSEIPRGYLKGDGFEAAVLPYKNSSIVMQAILPTPGKTPEQALAAATTQNARGERIDLDLKLPKFTLDFSSPLGSALVKMGMGIAFDKKRADFLPMGPSGFYIGQVLHKTRLEIDEQGTVAAAATAVLMRPTMAARQRIEKKVLVFDRPFGLILRDATTNAILFAGVIYDPQ